MDDIFEVHASYCRVFTDPKRLRIMRALEHGEKTVGQLAEEIHTSLPNTSQHLRLMREHGVLIARRQGRSVYYHIANENFSKGCAFIRQAIAEELQRRSDLSKRTARSADDE